MNKKAKAKALVFLCNKMSQAGLSEILWNKNQFGRIGFFVLKMFERGLARPRAEQFPPNDFLLFIFFACPKKTNQNKRHFFTMCFLK
jgi:hypothetical protein